MLRSGSDKVEQKDNGVLPHATTKNREEVAPICLEACCPISFVRIQQNLLQPSPSVTRFSVRAGRRSPALTIVHAGRAPLNGTASLQDPRGLESRSKSMPPPSTGSFLQLSVTRLTLAVLSVFLGKK